MADNVAYSKNKFVLQSIVLYIVDCVFIAIALYLAIIFRFDLRFPAIYRTIYLDTLPILIITTTISFLIFRLYKNIWQYASIEVMLQIVIACFVSGLSAFAISNVLNNSMSARFLVSRGIFSMLVILMIALTGGIRFALKIKSMRSNPFVKGKRGARRVMVVGAGWAGASTIRDIKSGRHGNCIPIVAIDDDASRVGTRIHGVPVREGTDKIKLYAELYKIDEIIIAIATPKGKIQDLVEICLSSGCKVKRVANLTEIGNNDNSYSVVRNIDLNDLLGRPEEKLDLTLVKEYFKEKVVLITGGGGTIGSELCRQIIPFDVKKIILYDVSENYIYDLKNELTFTFKEKAQSDIELCIGSVRDTKRLDEVFNKYKPDIVLHAAAHKHVPLMETCPEQAVKNNVFGTYYTALCAIKNNVKSFVMISTDKAVNPTSIMGVTKRLSEIIIEGLSINSDTKFMIVRFGNVLGSHGSVVPLFERQIRNGGPVTVTHKDVIRYFMTPQEATILVLQAAAIAKGGEIFVLDMGKPVRIYDLAKRMIQLYSDPEKDPVQIKLTGLRGGEKLYEELLMHDENIVRTDLDKIFVTKADDVSQQQIDNIINQLTEALDNNFDMRQCLHALVPSFLEANEANKLTNENQLSKHRIYEDN